ncbi:MAG: hypothetical protein SFW62_05700 [Alphaproteobacteria bacterium]|nr:hypothetical protein [Alphaproteobacteria bacterium]
MKYASILIFSVLAVTAYPAFAGTAEVRDVARLNNCTPKKIEVYEQSLGSEARTIYRVTCNMPKATNDTAKGADSLLVSCRDSLCQLIRPVAEEKK